MIWSRKPKIRTLTGAQAELTAMHFMSIKPEPHQHTWRVRVWTERFIDVRLLESVLVSTLKPLQGANLNAVVPSGSAEHLAHWIHGEVGLGVFCVEVAREHRFWASYEAPPVPDEGNCR